jgi:hypothetical protein
MYLVSNKWGVTLIAAGEGGKAIQEVGRSEWAADRFRTAHCGIAWVAAGMEEVDRQIDQMGI